MKLIGLCGFAGAGKSTAANFISDTVLHFAEPVKKIALGFGWDGQKDERGRRLLQLIGTECGRQYNPNIWVDKMREQIKKKAFELPDIIVIDDLRFDNEAEMVHEFGGVVVEIKRPGYGKTDHASEQGVSPNLIDVSVEAKNVGELNYAVAAVLDLPTTNEC